MKNHLFTFILLLFTISLFGQESKSTNKSFEANSYFKPVKYRNIGPFRGGRSVTSCGVKDDIFLTIKRLY